MKYIRNIVPADCVMHYRSQGMALTIAGRILRDPSAEDLIRRLNDSLDTGAFAEVASDLLEVKAEQWDSIEIGLRLGLASHILAVRVSKERAETWLELGIGASATVDAGD